MHGRSVLMETDAREALLRGVSIMAAVTSPTLGPIGRTVAVSRTVGSDPPEILDQAAVITRRTIEIDGPFENMGAMLLRHVVWRVHEAVGDGGATSAVFAGRLIEEAVNYARAGGDSLAIRRGIEAAEAVALSELQRLVRPIELPREISAIVAGSVRDARTAALIGEALEVVGPDGVLQVRDAIDSRTDCEYIEGIRWDAGALSPYLLRDDRVTTSLDDPCVLVTDYPLTGASDVIPALECASAVGRPLFIVAPGMHDAAVGVLVANRERGLLAVKAPEPVGQRDRAIEEIALIAGARLMCRARGDRMKDLQLSDLGSARQAWATRSMSGFVGARGERSAIRRRIAEVQSELARAEDDDTRKKLRDRISRLSGIAAIVRVGGQTESEREDLKHRVESAVASGRAALREGVVPGGGCALIAAARAIEQLDLGGDEAVGARALARALQEPLRVIATNSGVDASPIVQNAYRLVPDFAYDAVRREWVDPWRTGLLEPSLVLRHVIETSVSSALTVLFTEVLVRSAQPPVARLP